MKISIIIPACNEEKYIKKCLVSIEKASHNHSIETIVVINRCIDNTEKIAREFGAKIVKDESRNIARIRNAGIKEASGEIIITIDADSIMSENLIDEVVKSMKSNKYIGGGINIKPERTSAGIFCTELLVKTTFLFMGISVGSFWAKKEDYNKINGFNEELFIGEDIDFARRLKNYGKEKNKSFKNIKSAHIVSSCRKFDKFGDWHWFKFMFCDAKEVINGFKNNKNFAKKYFFDFEK